MERFNMESEHLKGEKKSVLIQIIKDLCRNDSEEKRILALNNELLSEAFNLASKELAALKKRTLDEIKRPILDTAMDTVCKKLKEKNKNGLQN